jgi:hypothetical protein
MAPRRKAEKGRGPERGSADGYRGSWSQALAFGRPAHCSKRIERKQALLEPKGSAKGKSWKKRWWPNSGCLTRCLSSGLTRSEFWRSDQQEAV